MSRREQEPDDVRVLTEILVPTVPHGVDEVIERPAKRRAQSTTALLRFWRKSGASEQTRTSISADQREKRLCKRLRLLSCTRQARQAKAAAAEKQPTGIRGASAVGRRFS